MHANVAYSKFSKTILSSGSSFYFRTDNPESKIFFCTDNAESKVFQNRQPKKQNFKDIQPRKRSIVGHKTPKTKYLTDNPENGQTTQKANSLGQTTQNEKYLMTENPVNKIFYDRQPRKRNILG